MSEIGKGESTFWVGTGRQQQMAAWNRIGTAIALGVIWTGTALGQFTPTQPQPTYLLDQPAEEDDSIWVHETAKMYAVAAAVAVAILVLSFVTGVYIRWSATTDPETLAKRDPWLRANWDRWKAAQDANPSEISPTTPAESAMHSKHEAPDGTT
jgi:hypothetical protein